MLTDHLDRAIARAAVALANRAPSVHNSQPWRWRIGDSEIHLFADRARALPATDPEGRDMRLSCGAALHHLRVALLAAGIGTIVHRLPDPTHPEHLATLDTRSGRPTPDDLARARAIESRRTDRRIFSTWPLPPELLIALTRAAGEEGALLKVIDREPEREAVARLVWSAAVLQAGTPAVDQETAAWTGRGRGAREGVPAANVPTGPNGTVAVRPFAAREQAQSGLGQGESDGTVLALLATSGDGAVDQLRAGEALSAVLLDAARVGLASCPISQPFEVAATRADLRAGLLGGAAEPQVLLRLGWAPMSAIPVPQTGRRPLADTIEPMGDRRRGSTDA